MVFTYDVVLCGRNEVDMTEYLESSDRESGEWEAID